jgi:uncharacterized protein involved in type VI secretion and phage assembly
MADSPQYIPLPLLEIDRRKAPEDTLMQELMEDILQISVEESLHLPGMFTLVIKNDSFAGNAEEDLLWRYKDLLEIGKTVKIGFQSSTTDAQEFSEAEQGYVLNGEITAIETHFTKESQAPVIVRGYDVSHRLHRGRHNRSFQNMTDSDIIQKLAKEVIPDLDFKGVESSGEPHDYVFQENQTNMQFFRQRAARLGFELFIQDNKLYFRKPKSGSTLSLKWLQDLHSFRVRATSAEQVSAVEVRGWDYGEKKPIVATANRTKQVITQTDNGKGSETSTKFQLDRQPPKLVVVDRPVFKAKEADTLAQALCDELGGEYVCADATAEGNPQIRPGKVVKLEEMGRYSGEYYITETRHLFHKRIYTTDFSVRGLRGGQLLEMLSAATASPPGHTLLVGIVTDNKDPQGWGRVKVKFPTLTEDHSSNWARVVAAGAGGQRGFDCLPEINDEVLVAFEHGDIHRPYVIGGVWNGKDAPSASVNDSIQDGKVRLRTFKTRTGHQMQFTEEDKGSSKAGVYIETKGGHKICLNDSDKVIEVETSNGHILRLSDMDNSITLSSKGSITIKAQTTLDITAGGIVTVRGQMIKLN